MRRIAVSVATLLVFLTAIWPLPASAQTTTLSPTSSLLVKTVAGLSAAEQADVIARNGGTETSSIPALSLHVVAVPASDLATILASYQADPQVQSVEENKVRVSEAMPSDPLYANQWALPLIGWDLVFGAVTPTGTATVALLDTGVDALHPELAGKVVAGTSVLDGSTGTTDPSGHGTWLAGIIAARSNTLPPDGIAGIGYDGVRVMPVTVLNANGEGLDSDVIAGVLWAADHGADVILMAFSNPGFSRNLQDAIDYAWSRGAVLVAAAGNSASSDPSFPAGDRGVMGVAATDAVDGLAYFSNEGQAVFIAAPGVDIQTIDIGDGYTVISGTSTSAAMVAGAAALLKAADPALSNGVIVGRLARNADPAAAQAQTGNGRINLARALADTSTEPVQPAGVPPVGDGGPFVGPYLAAGNAQVSGTVTDTSSNPLSGATVACTAGCNPTAPATTIANGTYGIFRPEFPGNPPPPAIIELTASKVGFNSASVTLTVTSNQQQFPNTDFQLTPACTPSSITTQPTGATKTVGESVTFSVTASGTAPLSYQWRKGGVNIFGATASSYSIASVVVADAGSYDVVVSNSCGSTTSTAAILTVNKADTTTSVSSSANPSVFGQAVTFTATVAVVAPGSGTPTGTVTFKDGSNAIAGCSNVSLPGATCPTSALAVGGHSITAVYSGDGNFNGTGTGSSTATTLAQTVNKADTTTSVSSSANPSVFGQAVTFTATVAVVAPGSGTPTGTVTFKDGSNAIAGCSNVSLPGATCPTSALAVGGHSITAVYSGDGNLNGTGTGSSTATALSQTVNKADTTTSVSSSVNPSVLGQAVTFTATVAVVAPGSGTPGGTVTFKDSGVAISGCSGLALTGGQAQCTPASLTVGNHPIAVEYGGDGNFNSSVSPPLIQSVQYAVGQCLGSPGHAILQPIDADGSSVFKQKSTVPVKFRVCDFFGNSVGTPGVVSGFNLVGVMTGLVTQSVDDLVDSTTPFSDFRWDPVDQQWIFNISTRNLTANKTYFYRILLNDNTSIDFHFGLK